MTVAENNFFPRRPFLCQKRSIISSHIRSSESSHTSGGAGGGIYVHGVRKFFGSLNPLVTDTLTHPIGTITRFWANTCPPPQRGRPMYMPPYLTGAQCCVQKSMQGGARNANQNQHTAMRKKCQLSNRLQLPDVWVSATGSNNVLSNPIELEREERRMNSC